MQQPALDLPPAPDSYTAAAFIPAAANRVALEWLSRWPHWPGAVLAIAGPAGCGKTHLAHLFAGRSGATWADSPAGALTRLQDGPTALVLDGADAAVADGPAAEEALFHLLNRLAAAGGSLLLTGRAPPAAWPSTLADLRTRLRALPVAIVDPPDDGLLAAVLRKGFADRQLRVGEAVVSYAVRRMQRSFAAARALVAAADRLALSEARPITPHLVARVLPSVPTDTDPGVP